MSDNSFSERYFPPKTRPIPHNTTENTEKKKGKKKSFRKIHFSYFPKGHQSKGYERPVAAYTEKDDSGTLHKTFHRQIVAIVFFQFIG